MTKAVLAGAWVAVVLAAWVPCSAEQHAAPALLVLRFEPSTTYQTIEGWGIALPSQQAGEWISKVYLPVEKKGDRPKPRTASEAIAIYDATPAHSRYSDALNREIAAATVEQGFNRFRITVGWPVEFENDNGDPNVLDEKAFRFKWQDSLIREQLLPMKEMLAKRGERAVVHVSFDHRSSIAPAWLLTPAEYAEFTEACVRYFKKTYDFQPDWWTVLNEPGNGRPGNPKICAELTAAAGKRLEKAGLSTRMSGPDCVTPKQCDEYLKAMEQVQGALGNFGQITYHLYWDPENVEARRIIRAWGEKLKVPVAQTEWMGAKQLELVRHLHLCLTEANVVAWDRYVRDLTVDDKAGTLERQPTAWYLRQYFRYIRPGAVRVKMESADASVKPVAFLSPARKPVMVFLNESTSPRPVKVEGLPAVTYHLSCSVGGKPAQSMPEIVLAAEKPLEVTLPASSVLTVTADPPTPGPEFLTRTKR